MIDPEIVDGLSKTIARVVAAEMRMFGLLSGPDRIEPPPPFDLDAEEQLLGEVIHGAKTPADFNASWCYSPFVSASIVVLEVCQVPPGDDLTPRLVFAARALSKAGFRGEGVATELARIAERCAPCPIDLLCARIRSLARRRSALMLAVRLCAQLRDPTSEDLDLTSTMHQLSEAPL